MQSLSELGQSLSARRRALGLKQGEVALWAGLTQSSLSRLERGQLAEFGSRKLLTLLAVLGLEIEFVPFVADGSLDALLKERSGV